MPETSREEHVRGAPWSAWDEDAAPPDLEAARGNPPNCESTRYFHRAIEGSPTARGSGGERRCRTRAGGGR